MEDPTILFPSVDTTDITTSVPMLVVAYSKAYVAQTKMPRSVKRALYLQVCTQCLGDCFTMIKYHGPDLVFVCEQCLAPGAAKKERNNG